MKSLCLFSLLTAAPLLAVASSLDQMAVARCVVTDVGVQVAIHGSRQPAQQVNEVDFDSSQPCSGNQINGRGTQVYVGGTEPVRQERSVRYQIKSDSENQSRRRRKMPDGPAMFIPVEVQVDVDNPAARVRY